MLVTAVWLLEEVATLRKISLLVRRVLHVSVYLIGLLVLSRPTKPAFPMISLLAMLRYGTTSPVSMVSLSYYCC